MENHQLLKSQKNEIFSQITHKGLNPANFRFQVSRYDYHSQTGRPLGSYECSELVHEDGYFFKFNCIGSMYRPEYRPGWREISEKTSNQSWPGVIRHFGYWLDAVKTEISEPDLWAELGKFSSRLALPELKEGPKLRFSDTQIEEIKTALEKAEQEIIEEFKPTREQIQSIHECTQYLVDQAKRQDVKSWRYLVIGLFMSTAMDLAIDPNKFSRYWEIIGSALTKVRYLLGF